MSVDEAASRAVLSLKAPAGHTDEGAPFLASLLKDLRELDSLTAAKEGSARWAAEFPLGSVVKGAVAETKDYGVVVDIPGHEDVVGARRADPPCTRQDPIPSVSERTPPTPPLIASSAERNSSLAPPLPHRLRPRSVHLAGAGGGF